MSSKNLKDLSPSEGQIMRILWENEEAVQAFDLIDYIEERYEKKHKRTTLSSFLERLIHKGYVTTYRSGRYTYIQPIVTEDEYLQMIASKQVHSLYGGSITNFVACFERSEGISPEERKKLKEFLDARDN